MEGVMIRVWTVWTLYVSFWCCAADLNPPCDPEKQYKHSERCCTKCQPGTHMIKRCTPNTGTVCSPCGPNEYMSVWNDDLKCALHMVCDAGKALQVLHNGNSTYPRECVCTDGYHFNANQEICMENTNCPPGFGVQIPVQRNKNTVCVQCQEGYFSNTSSLTELCRPWTNCSEFGHQQIIPGTNISDAVCDHLINTHNVTQMIILITLLIALLAAILFTSVWCYMKNPSTLKVQEWMQDTCNKLCGSEKKSQYSQANTIEHGYTIITNAPVEQNIHSDNLKEMETSRGRMIPMEDEYMDQRRSPEPENESMVAGMESLSDLDSGSLETSCAYSDTSSDRLLCSNEVINPPCPEHHYDQSAKETPRKRREEHCISDPLDDNYVRQSSRHEFHIYPQALYHIPENNTGKEPCSCFTNAQYTRSSSRSSTDNPETPPTPSGNVTGNNNTTVISSAPVMNIKTDMVVVYYRGSSEDTHISCDGEENIKRPMQEERQDHCDSFVANTPPYNYNDIPCSSVPDTECAEAAGNLIDSNCPVMSSQDHCDITYCQNTVVPVQEEGKPEFYHLEVI